MKKKVYLYSFMPMLLLSGGFIELDLYFAFWLFNIYPPVWIFTFPICWLMNYSFIKKAAKKCNYIFENRKSYNILVIKSTILCFIFDLCITLIMMAIYSYLTVLSFDHLEGDLGKMTMDLVESIAGNPLSDIRAIFIMVVVIFIVKFIHYLVYLHFIVKKLKIDGDKKKKFAICTIIYTIPYHYFLPSEWLTFK